MVILSLVFFFLNHEFFAPRPQGGAVGHFLFNETELICNTFADFLHSILILASIYDFVC